MRKYILVIIIFLLIPVCGYAGSVNGVEYPAEVNSVTTPDKVSGVDGLASGGDSALYTAATAIYDFNNDATDTKGGHDGAANGVTYGTTTPPEGTHYAIFDTNGDRVVVTDHADFEPGDGDWSLSFWAYWTNVGEDYLFGKFSVGDTENNITVSVSYEGDDYYLVINQSQGWNVDTWITTFAPSTGGWFHVAIGFDASGDHYILWVSTAGGTFGDTINGVTETADQYPGESTDDVTIGGDDDDDGRTFYGYLDEVVWWKGYELTATDAEAIYDKDWR